MGTAQAMLAFPDTPIAIHPSHADAWNAARARRRRRAASVFHRLRRPKIPHPVVDLAKDPAPVVDLAKDPAPVVDLAKDPAPVVDLAKDPAPVVD
ncbi:MAG: hypothetical protein ACK5OB_05675, partial [Pirellula sp.]